MVNDNDIGYVKRHLEKHGMSGWVEKRTDDEIRQFIEAQIDLIEPIILLTVLSTLIPTYYLWHAEPPIGFIGGLLMGVYITIIIRIIPGVGG